MFLVYRYVYGLASLPMSHFALSSMQKLCGSAGSAGSRSPPRLCRMSVNNGVETGTLDRLLLLAYLCALLVHWMPVNSLVEACKLSALDCYLNPTPVF